MERVYLEYVGNFIELLPGETCVGRDLDCAIRLDDAHVSRHHVRVVRRGAEIFVEDLGSRNGTLLNGRAITAPILARDGDVIAIGARTLTVRTSPSGRARRATLGPSSARSDPDERAARAATAPAIRTQPIAMRRRCPHCGATVTAFDDSCESCGMGPDDDESIVTSLRRHARRPIAVDLRYESPELEIEVTSRDLSESGVFVCSFVLDPIGTPCQLTFALADGELAARGVVRRVVEHNEASDHPVGLGVEFVDLGAPERAWLRDLISDPDHHVRRASSDG